jgi:3-dehydroquinate synthase
MHPQPVLSRVDLDNRSYDILIGQGLLAREGSFDAVPKSDQALIVTNDRVQPLFGGQLRGVLGSRHREVHICVLPDGEAFKDWRHLNTIFDALLSRGADRKTVIYALGGGVVGDMAGFAAACYMRGVPFVQIPTTLLAQVDSSVGGKTAVNHPLGKNMIGAFYQPVKVLCDLDTLSTLDNREFRSGLAEVIKYGAIADPAFFAWLEAAIPALLARDPTALAQAVKRSCDIKADVVARDERESGVRAHLNLGHTFGHAIETGMGYGTWRHGEAVAAGMVMAARLSCQLDLLRSSDADRLEALVAAAGLPTRGPTMTSQDYLRHMALDKKAEAGRINYVLLNGLGSAVVRAVSPDLVAQTLRHCGAA